MKERERRELRAKIFIPSSRFIYYLFVIILPGKKKIPIRIKGKKPIIPGKKELLYLTVGPFIPRGKPLPIT